MGNTLLWNVTSGDADALAEVRSPRATINRRAGMIHLDSNFTNTPPTPAWIPKPVEAHAQYTRSSFTWAKEFLIDSEL
jgi:hypothetical protein